jgi:hypothetical protein
MTKVRDGYLALSVEKEQALAVFQEIMPKLIKLTALLPNGNRVTNSCLTDSLGLGQESASALPHIR